MYPFPFLINPKSELFIFFSGGNFQSKHPVLSLPPALLSEHVLGPGGHDDDLSLGGGHTDLNTTVTILGQLPINKKIQGC